MKDFARRIEALEAENSAVEGGPMVMMVRYVGGEISGWRGDGFAIRRNLGESEEALAARAKGEAMRKARPPHSLIVIYSKTDTADACAPEALQPVAPEPVPSVFVPPVIEAPKVRIRSIRELERGDPDNPHWMG